MKNRRLYYFSYIFLCLIFGQSLTSAQIPTPEPELEKQVSLPTVSEENLIHFGDLIDVDVVGSVEYDWRGMLTPEGFITGISYNENPIYALCRDEKAVETDIVKAFSKILRQPKVIVRIIDRSNRPASVLYGAVKTPQRFSIKRPVFLNELIIRSGGFTEKVSGDIKIFRPKNSNCLNEIEAKEKIINVQERVQDSIAAAQVDNLQYINIKIADLLGGKKEANPQILSGDVITVLETEYVYVIGGVVNPKQVPLRSEITLSRAVTSAGGLSKDALPQKVTIFRRENNISKIIEADLDKIKMNPAEDIVLQASDIVEVTQKGRAKRKYPPIIKNTGLAEKNTAELPLRIID